MKEALLLTGLDQCFAVEIFSQVAITSPYISGKAVCVPVSSPTAEVLQHSWSPSSELTAVTAHLASPKLEEALPS